MQVTLHFLGLCSAPRLLQKGTSQLAHRHPSVELRDIESKRGEVPLPTQHAGRVLGTLPGGGGSEGKEVRMQEWGTWGEERSQKQKCNLEPFHQELPKSVQLRSRKVQRCTFFSDGKEVASLYSMMRAPRKSTQTT